MDRRRRKTREAIFAAFTELLAKKDLSRITVSEIIEKADVGRATFYAHFETRDDLLKELCAELFCHIFDTAEEADGSRAAHRHIFTCDAAEPVFLHLLRHLQKNDHHILELLFCGNDLFLQYFKDGLRQTVTARLTLFAARKSEMLPDDFWVEHIVCVFVETVRWWAAHGLHEMPETVAEYFFAAV